jgi:sialic acid synthase SpsE
MEAVAHQGGQRVTVQVIEDSAELTRVQKSLEYLRRFCIPIDAQINAARFAVGLGLAVGATVTEPRHIPILQEAGVTFLKILSSDISYGPLLQEAASSGLPVYLSTGAADLEDITAAVEVIQKHPNAQLRLIHTVLVVPTPAEILNLRAIPWLRAKFGVPVAYGQHASDRQAVLTAAALGAESAFIYVAEEHVDELPDRLNSVRCGDIASLLEDIRLTEEMLGAPARTSLHPAEEEVKKNVRRSIVAARRIAAGEEITHDHLTFKRPGTGISPLDIRRVVGRKAERDFDPNEDITGGLESN